MGRFVLKDYRLFVGDVSEPVLKGLKKANPD
jgi:hypothetical protein